MKNLELLSFATADELASRAASTWLDEIESANRAGKTHCVALSGGRIAQKFFASVVEQAKTRRISFDRIHFFWADERCLPPNDPDSNFKLASDLLLEPLKVSESQIHRIRGEDLPETAAETSAEELRRVAGIVGSSRLDLIFLGMGEDGHVASLFPNAQPQILNGAGPFLAVENSPKPPPKRVSLSYAAIAAAKKVWVLVSGAGKEAAFRESLKPDGQTPLARVIRSRSRTEIFSDIQAG